MRRWVVWIFIDMVNARGIEKRRSTFDAVDLVPLGEKKFGEIGAILTGDSCYQGSLQATSLFRNE
jgi:hypothetical protein